VAWAKSAATPARLLLSLLQQAAQISGYDCWMMKPRPGVLSSDVRQAIQFLRAIPVAHRPDDGILDMIDGKDDLLRLTCSGRSLD
tara:strand:+ start:45162 stop:45416 length:255 start_codon:yes stop_codon:yes gene_type:complete